MPDDGQPSRQSKVREGLQFLATWSAIGAAILLMGAISTRGMYVMRQIELDRPVPRVLTLPYFSAVLYFSVCGGLTIGLLFLAWWIAKPGGFGWGMGVIVLGLLVTAIFIWPTPYKYYPTDDTRVLLRVTRVSGHGEIIPRGGASQSLTPRLPQQPREKP
jgi:hypothetical protein